MNTQCNQSPAYFNDPTEIACSSFAHPTLGLNTTTYTPPTQLAELRSSTSHFDDAKVVGWKRLKDEGVTGN